MQLKEEKFFYAQSITGERYTSVFLFSFSRREKTSLEKKSILITDPPQKNAYKKIFLRFEIAGHKNLLQVLELQGEKWGDVCELAIDVWIWLSPDPAGQFFNPYSYGGDPINFVDPDGEWLLSLAKIAVSPVGLAINIAGALDNAFEADSFSEGVGVFFGQSITNSVGDLTAVFYGAVSLSAGVYADKYNIVTGDWDNVGKGTGVSLAAAFLSDYNTVSNSVAAVGRGDFGEAFSNLGQAGVSSTVSSVTSTFYSANKAWGSGDWQFKGSWRGYEGNRSLLWEAPEGSFVLGGRPGGYRSGNIFISDRLSGNRRKSVLFHENIHARQFGRYGFFHKVSDNDPVPRPSACGSDPVCLERQKAWDSYTNYGEYPDRINRWEMEAEIYQNAYDDYLAGKRSDIPHY